MFQTRLCEGPSYHGLLTILGSRITYILMIGLGLLLGGWFVVEDQYVRSAPTTFRKAPCVVEDSGVQIRGWDRYGVATSFVPVITFTFTAADGRERTVAGYRLYEGGMSETEALDVSDRYEPDQETICYYDPADPDHAVLSLEADVRHLGIIFALSVLLLLGGVAGWAFLEFVLKPGQTRSLPPPDVLDAAARPTTAASDALQAEPSAAARSEGLQAQV